MFWSLNEWAESFKDLCSRFFMIQGGYGDGDRRGRPEARGPGVLWNALESFFFSFLHGHLCSAG